MFRQNKVLVFAVAAIAFVIVAKAQTDKPVTEVCLGCICEAISGCNRTLTCNGDVCGLFHITWAYWSDGGKHTLGESPDSPQAYSNCVNDPYCAANTIQGYMLKYGQDCNGDGVINCYDHMAIHKLGGFGCRGQLPDKYKATFDQCLAQVSG
uniref:lysozyme n=1 Tax=Xenopsylla cheopis TaxID=163159 RepID=A0A6M2E1A3_XENCH